MNWKVLVTMALLTSLLAPLTDADLVLTETSRTEDTNTIISIIEEEFTTCSNECLDWVTLSNGTINCTGGFDNVCRASTRQVKQVTQTFYSGPVNYHNGVEYVPIVTDVVSSAHPLFDYEVTTGMYSAYFKEDPTEGQVVQYNYSGVTVTFQPMALNYRNDLDQIEQIQMVSAVTGAASDNEFTYVDAYGSGRDLSYKYFQSQLKESLDLDAVTPAPAQYIIDGGNPTLDLDFVLETNSNHLVIDGVSWDKSSTVETSNEVYVRDDSGNDLYHLRKPYAYDAAGAEVLLTYQFKKQGNSLYVVIKTNYSWLSDAARVYPVEIDPTISLDSAFNFKDTTLFESSPSTVFGSSTTLWIDGIDTQRQEAFLTFNITNLPSAVNSTLCMYLFQNDLDAGESLDVTVHKVYNTFDWSEANLDWDAKPTAGTDFNVTPLNITTIPATYDGSRPFVNNYSCFNVFNGTNQSIEAGEQNITFMINVTAPTGVESGDDLHFYSRDHTNVLEEPYLNVTYTDPAFYTVSSCAVINETGANVNLTANIWNSSISKCIYITAPNVVFDCQGNTIQGNNVSDYGVYVHAGNSQRTFNVTVRNCSITNWDTAAVESFKGHENNFYNLTVYNNPDYGLFLSTDSDRNLVHNVTAYGNDNAALKANSADYYNMTDIVAYDNLFGMEITNGDYLRFTNVHLYNNTEFDYLTSTSSISTGAPRDNKCKHIMDNVTLSRNNQISFFNNTQNTVVENWNNNFTTIVFCGLWDSTISNVTLTHLNTTNNGIIITQSRNITVERVTMNRSYGVYAWYVTNLTLQNLNFHNSSIITHFTQKSTFNNISIISSSLNNSFKDALRTNDGDFSIYDRISIKNAIYSGIGILNSNPLNMSNISIDGTKATGISLVTVNNGTFINITLNNTITRGLDSVGANWLNFTNILIHNIQGAGIDIDNHVHIYNITVFNMTDHVSQIASGIRAQGDNITINQSYITQVQGDGFSISGGTGDIFVDGMVSHNNTDGGDGIGCNDPCTVINSLFYNNSDYGLFLNGGAVGRVNSEVRNVTVNTSNYYGAYYASGGNLSIDRLTIDGSTQKGMYMVATRGNTSFKHSRIINSGNDGLHLISSDGVADVFSNLTIANNGNDGFLIQSSNRTVLENSSIYGNTRYGIHFSSTNLGNISFNQIYNNLVGLYSTASNNNYIFNNLINESDAMDGTGGVNFLNTTEQSGSRIFSTGNKIGGNFWANTSGDGFSQDCVDADLDGFCDTAFTPFTSNTDYLAMSRTFNTSAPRYKNISNNASNIEFNMSVNFTITLSAINNQLDTFKFATNESRAMANISPTIQISGFNATISYNFTVNVSRGAVVCGQFWFNNTLGVANTSNQSCFTVVNSLPKIRELVLDPSPVLATQNLSFNLTVTDYDNDPVDNHTEWFVNSIEQQAFENQSIINAAELDESETWLVRVRSNDTTGFSPWVNDSIVVNDVTAPVINSITTSTTSAASDASVTFSANLTDLGGIGSDACTFSVRKENFNDAGWYNLSKTTTLSNNVVSISQPMSAFNGTGTLQFVAAYCTDLSSNAANNESVGINITITTAVGGGTSGGGGGGGGGKTIDPLTNLSIEQIQGICGNGVCELGESPLDCPRDCVPDIINLEKIFCMPAFKCGNWLNEWFISGTMFGVIGFIMFIYIRKEQAGKL